MSFTGTPVVVQVSKNLFRITGVSLDANASGIIGFSDKAVPADVALVQPNWQPYTMSDGDLVGLQDAVKVSVDVTANVATVVPISIVKTGTSHADFAATLHNETQQTDSGSLEIYVEWGGH